MKIKSVLYIIVLICAITSISFGQQLPFVGIDYIPTQREGTDLDAIEYYQQRRAASDARLNSEAKKMYQSHIDIILQNIPSTVPDAKGIAEKYINKYHEIIDYPKNQYGMFQDKAKNFINLIKYDIEKDIIDSYNKYINSLLQSGYNKMVEGKYEQSIGDFNKIIEIVPNYDVAYLYRGIAKVQISESSDALKDLNKALTLNPNEPEIVFWKARAKSDLGDLRGAIIDYKKVIDIKPNYSMAWNNMAFCKLELKEYNSALSDVNKAIEFDNENADAYDTRGEIKYNLKNYASAISDLDKSIQINPQYQNSYYYRGLSKIKLQKKNEGCIDLSKAGELGKTEAYEAIKMYCK